MRLKLALLLVLGVVLTAVALEGLARLAAPEQQSNSCLAPGHHRKFFRANCVSAPMKMAESPWLRYTTNECGYRTAESCLRKAPDQLRVAAIGTSITYGLWVPYPDTWAARATGLLKTGCRRPVDIQNQAFSLSQDGSYAIWHDLVDVLPQAMALRPDAIVTILGPTDLGFYQSAPAAEPRARAPAAPHKSLKQRLIDVRTDLNTTRSIALFRQWWQSDEDRYLKSQNNRGDTTDFLRRPMSPAWRMRLGVADDAFTKIGAAANAQHVPWFVILSPSYGQALLAAHAHDPGSDPYQLGAELRPLVEKHGGVFYDLTGDMATQAHPARDYYVVNGHPNAHGESLIAGRVASLLTTQAPAFADCGLKP